MSDVSEGRRIGKYLAERALGAGSFATVWLAYDELLETRVAIKVLADNWARNPGVRQRFVEEARILRKIDHDRMVRVHEINELEDGRPYFVMAWADRGTLHERIVGRADPTDLPLDEALRLGIEICEALAVVHDFGVVHRDIKPSNILFRSVRSHERIAAQRAGRDIGDEAVMLGDFGLAKDLAAASGFTLAAGTPAYMAPEQAQPMAVIDRRVDVFAVTAVVYELIAGRPAFASDTLSGVRRSRANTRPDKLSSHRRDLPPAIDRLMETGLARSPDDRYPSVIALGDALTEVLEALNSSGPKTLVSPGPIGLPGPARTPSAPPPPLPTHGKPMGVAGRVLDLVAGVRERITSPEGQALLAEAEQRLTRHLTVAVVGDARGPTATLAWRLFGARLDPRSQQQLSGTALRLGRGTPPQAVVTAKGASAQPLEVRRDTDGTIHLGAVRPQGSGARLVLTLEPQGPDDIDVVTAFSPDEAVVASSDVVLLLIPADASAPAEMVNLLSATLRRAVAGPVAFEALVVPVAGATSAEDVAAALRSAPGVGALIPTIEVLGDAAAARIGTLLDEVASHRSSLIGAAAGIKLLSAAADHATSPTARAEVLEGIDGLRAEVPALAEVELLHDLTSGKANLPPALRADLRRLLLFARPATRLGLAPDADPATLRAAVERTGTNWRVLENTGRVPFSARRAMLIAQQSLDRLHAELNPYG
jgi:serine/threonine protein kinase